MSSWKVIPEIPFHFATTTITDWRYVFTEIRYFEILIDALKFCADQKGLHLHGYVLMPNHAHYIVSTEEGAVLSNIMRDLNRFTSSKITGQLEMDGRKEILADFRRAAQNDGRGNTYKVWQDGFHPIALDDADVFLQKLEYIHHNPVRKGFVEKPEDWKYSSARNYVLEDHSVLEVELIE